MSIELDFRVRLSGSNTWNQHMICNSSTDVSSILMTVALYSKVSQANCHTKQLINAVYFIWACPVSWYTEKFSIVNKPSNTIHRKKLFTLWFTLWNAWLLQFYCAHEKQACTWTFLPKFFFLLGCHFPDHVVQNAAVVEVSELHISVKSHDSLKGFPGVQLLGSKKVIQAAELCTCYLTSQ